MKMRHLPANALVLVFSSMVATTASAQSKSALPSPEAILSDVVEAAVVGERHGQPIDPATLYASFVSDSIVPRDVLAAGHFTTAEGLSPVGSRVLSELQTAPFHGLPVDRFISAELIEALATLERPGDMPALRTAAGASWFVRLAQSLPDEDAAISAAKVATAARLAAEGDLRATAWFAAHDRAMNERAAARAIVECALAEGLHQWALAMDPTSPPLPSLATADVAVLDRSLTALIPVDPDYNGLVRELAHLRAVENAGGWPGHPIDPVAASSLEGQAALRERLAIDRWFEGPQPMIHDDRHGAAAPVDTALQSALARFQEHHQLDVTGLPDAQTLAALAVPASTRTQTLLTNLERLRAARSRHDAGVTAVLVNVAAFEVRLMLDGVEAMRTRAVVGATTDNGRNRTPLFSDVMERIELNPVWYVPPRIARRVYASPSRGYQWVGGRLIQRPGPHNSLGRAKFLFPNAHAVYLHDTNRPDLFEQSQRAASSGCVRVADPLALAAHIIAHDSGRPLEAIRAEVDAVIASGRTEVIALAEELPVHLEYRTAWVAESGRVAWASDVYGLDAP